MVFAHVHVHYMCMCVHMYNTCTCACAKPPRQLSRLGGIGRHCKYINRGILTQNVHVSPPCSSPEPHPSRSQEAEGGEEYYHSSDESDSEEERDHRNGEGNSDDDHVRMLLCSIYIHVA